MWVTLSMYTGLAIATVLLAMLVTGKQNQTEKYTLSVRDRITDRAVLCALFLILSTVLVLRVNIGNDYYRYSEIMHELRYDGYVITEPGFNLVCKLILKVKLWWDAGYQICFAFFAVFSILFFLKGMYDLSDRFFWSFFLFMSLGMYFQMFSTVRYYLALAIVVYAIRFLLDKRYVVFVLLVLLASSFHKSALFVLPVYFLASFSWKKWHLIVFGALSVQFLIFKDFYLKIMLRLYPSYSDEAEFLMGGTSVANLFRCFAVLVLCIVYYQKCIKGNRKNSFFFYLNVMTVAIYTCGYYIPVISRLGYFLNISQLFLIPSFIQAEENQKKRRILCIAVLVVGMVYFVLLYKKMTGSLAIVPYQSWVFQKMDEIKILEQ